MNPQLLAEAVAFAQTRESTREIDFSDQERIFGSLLGSVPTKRATDQRARHLQGLRRRRVR